MTEIELLINFYKDTERQGPGSSLETLKALNLININRKNKLKIADIGCGSGSQTITLAQNLEGQITAIDLFPEFLDELNIRSKKLGLQKKIKTMEKSMEELPFNNNEFDIIWSEGAIYIMGFENGIKNILKLIKLQTK